MKELIDLKRIWDWCASKWKNSFGSIALAVLAFVFGMLVEQKSITDDCRFAKNFRDGTQVYDCSQRVR
jgi:hypothetical protein